jgi:hypothetical protein
MRSGSLTLQTLGLSFVLAVSGCATTRFVKVDSETKLDQATCLQTDTTRYTTESEIKRVERAIKDAAEKKRKAESGKDGEELKAEPKEGQPENKDELQVRIFSTDSKTVFVEGCANLETQKAVLEAYSTVKVSQIQSATKFLVSAFHAANLTPEQRLVYWHDIRKNLLSDNPVIRVEQANALREQNISPAPFLSGCGPVAERGKTTLYSCPEFIAK